MRMLCLTGVLFWMASGLSVLHAEPPASSTHAVEVGDGVAASPSPSTSMATATTPDPATPLPPGLEDESMPTSLSAGEVVRPMLKTVFALGVVVLLAWLTLHKGMGRLMERAQAGKRMRVIERVALDARRSLFLVEVDGRTLVVGGGDVTRLDAPSSGISFSDGAALRAAAFDKVLAQTSGGAATTTTTTTTATEPA